MKAVILAGGLGTRISEESDSRPKPMIEIGGMPILWHIIKSYSYYGIDDFIICLGYKGYMIKEYFCNYYTHHSDLTIDLCKNFTTIHNNKSEPWRITLVDTGENTLTGGRMKRIKNYIGNETFCFTYGDGVCDVDIRELIKYHNMEKKNGIKATLTAIMPQGRYGALQLKDNIVERFIEKPETTNDFVNGGFFVLEPDVLDYIDGDLTSWELEPLERLTQEGKVQAFKHFGFWQAMDTLRDKRKLEEYWNTGQAPWKKW